MRSIPVPRKPAYPAYRLAPAALAALFVVGSSASAAPYRPVQSPALQTFVAKGHAGPRESVIYAFQGMNGAYPYGSLLDLKGVIYGTTSSGGLVGSARTHGPHYDSGVFAGYGTVFGVAVRRGKATEMVLHNFAGYPTDGSDPLAGLIADKSGTLYGTTCYGGVKGYGTAFKLTPGPSGWSETILYNFQGPKAGKDGTCPAGGLLADSSGGLYGTTEEGGNTGCSNGCGTVFKLTPSASGYTETILYRFAAHNDGSSPQSPLTADSSGALYGTSYFGGNAGFGSVFKLTPSGTGYSESVIHSFTGVPTDGAQPIAGVVVAHNGVVYGTTESGGTVCGSGCGTVYSLTPGASGYTEKLVYSFQGGNDGYFPYGGLVMTKTGALFGTTFFGGGTACNGTGCGIVFKMVPSHGTFTEQITYDFQGNTDGAQPGGSLINMSGTLLGTTYGGGGVQCFTDDLNCGTVFSLKP